MATKPEDDVLELGEAPDEQETPLEINEEAEDQPEEQDGEEDDLEIPTFGDDGEEAESDSALAKHLRAQIRERDRRIKEIEQGAKPAPEIVVGEKPTLESCEYDEEKFEAELDAYKDRKRQAEERANQGKEAQKAEQEAWQADLATYAKKRAALPYRDIDDAENTVVTTLSQPQQAMIVKTANDPAKLIYALGKHPAKLAAVSEITDPIKFIAATVRLEAEMRMAKRKPTAEPDKITRGSASLSATTDKHLAALEKKAAGGDRSELIAYKAKLKAQGK